MKARPLILWVGLASLAGLGAVLADERCNVRVADWQPRSAVVRMAETLGWTVQRIKTDDGCYVIQAQDRDGKEVRARVEPATLQILSTRAVRERRGHDENDDHDDGERRADRGRRGSRGDASVGQTAPADPNAPVPKNGSINGRPQVQVR
jgi:hypothetical protein